MSKGHIVGNHMSRLIIILLSMCQQNWTSYKQIYVCQPVISLQKVFVDFFCFVGSYAKNLCSSFIIDDHTAHIMSILSVLITDDYMLRGPFGKFLAWHHNSKMH